MFTFCNVSYETKQKNVNKFSKVGSTDWKSSLMIQCMSQIDQNRDIL